MDGKGRCLDNAKMERFWWSLKYENIYLSDYKSLPQMRRGVQIFLKKWSSVMSRINCLSVDFDSKNKKKETRLGTAVATSP